jgi:hypothetical protein
MKEFFKIEESYRFEWGDFWCLTTIINVALVITFGLSASWFGLGLAVAGTAQDLVSIRRINGLLTHLAMVVLNSYFLLIFYQIL